MQGETAERILKTAQALMIERGYSAFSYADISEAVEIKKPSIHHHFPTKAGLAAAVLKAHREKAGRRNRTTRPADRKPLETPSCLCPVLGGVYSRTYSPLLRCGAHGSGASVIAGGSASRSAPAFQGVGRLARTNPEGGREDGCIKLQDSAATEAQTLMAVVHGAMLSARATGNF